MERHGWSKFVMMWREAFTGPAVYRQQLEMPLPRWIDGDFDGRQINAMQIRRRQKIFRDQTVGRLTAT